MEYACLSFAQAGPRGLGERAVSTGIIVDSEAHPSPAHATQRRQAPAIPQLQVELARDVAERARARVRSATSNHERLLSRFGYRPARVIRPRLQQALKA